MPILETNSIISRKKLFKLFVFLTIPIFLSGCSVIGTNSPSALQVTTKPEASLFLDGKLLGKTPYFSDQLKTGTYTLKITTSDASYVAKVGLNPGTLTVIKRDLAANFMAQAGEQLSLNANASGLSVVSNPQGADLTLDGKLLGKTPVLVSEVGEGDHNLQLALTGYVSRQFAIKTTSKYQLVAEVTLASEIAKGTNTTQVPSPLPQAQQVEILNTPQGFLRVRADPTIEASETGRVSVGSQYDIIQEIPDWVKIRYDGNMGWVSSQFTKKVEAGKQ